MPEVLLRSERAHLRWADGETFLIDPIAGAQFRLNPVAASIAEALGAPIGRAELHARVRTRFDVSAEKCAHETDRFVDQLASRGLVETRPAAEGDDALRRRYLDLLKDSLVNLVYAEDGLRLDAA